LAGDETFSCDDGSMPSCQDGSELALSNDGWKLLCSGSEPGSAPIEAAEEQPDEPAGD
jgi:hypothetical protein